jgi:hypothetical protein
MSQKGTIGQRRSALPPDHLMTEGGRADEDRLIGGDTGLAAVMTRARLVARSNAPVLLFR